ncbi:biotin-independent malonate decarboxylase subunit beta [Bordetella genomosp. 11]|uniref:Biotin-independent malonate decarboxylase subunit beta n=1 Tax=Bordetella genomosp. 11 TaxID=1416808 RepID=A0A261UGC3_9BORD|nr:biotin-independent malonate decarboxylase subunit beta [Bordetella genomosp. 11]OZI60651.1 biotin-independent malonate decarboxylase subunit beta [Bordetella genomosp. 11]
MSDIAHPNAASPALAGDASWYEASARQRVNALLDDGSFVEFVGPQARETSPHLALFDLPEQFDDGMVVGAGKLDGNTVLIAAQEGKFMGGAFGEVHGAKLTGLLRAAAVRRTPVLILFETGGVRLQEANAGELAIAEIMRALLDARMAGVPVIGLIGGRAGCYGGGSLIAGCCSGLAISEQGRLSVSGPEVIETNRGAGEFDASDRPLIWRTMGGRHRYLLGAVDAYADDTVPAFRAAALRLIAQAPELDFAHLARTHARLAARLRELGNCADARDAWQVLGVDPRVDIPDIPHDAFVELAGALKEARHVAE